MRLPFLVALSLSVILLIAWVAAGAWNRHARRLERERRAVVVARLQSMTLVPPLADTEMSDCSIDSVLCFSSPLRPKQSLPAVTRTLRAVGHVTDSRCGRLPRGLTQCYLVAEVKGVEVMVVVFDELDVPASRKAERLRLDGSTGDVLLLGGPL